jgi:hypothetical protein
VTDTTFSHADDQPDGGRPNLPTPSDRLCRLIKAGGYKVVGYDELLGGQDAAAVVRCGSSIALNAERVTPGMIATMLAQQHGLGTASAAFRWYAV